ncbi:MAG TPA: DEAD/DEAH box helicase, partial [Anaerolineales bacterium]|nr:DEAD/DEAH box helicase [Anaerolineales bacterium]
MSVEEALEGLRRDPRFMENVSAWERLPPRPAAYAGFPDRLNPRLAAAVRRLGIPELFVHQAEAVRAALEGDNLAVVTGTASGKTLCYNLPVLHDLLADPEARALYLFPTKALAQDQAAALGELLGALDAAEQIPVRTYDGDTPSSERPAI